MPEKIKFEIDDSLSFAANLEAYRKSLDSVDENLPAALVAELHSVLAGTELDREAAYDRLFSAMSDEVS